MKTKEFKMPRTRIARIREENSSQMDEICQLLGWTTDEYCWNQFREYQLFVAELCAGWPEVRREVEYSPVFRGFFNNEWNLRNENEFLPTAYEMKYDSWFLLREFRDIHDYKALLDDERFMMKYEQIRGLI